MRTKGARNKPKLISVQLSELNKIFKPESVINISMEYKFLFLKTEEISIDKGNNLKDNNKIKFQIIDLDDTKQ